MGHLNCASTTRSFPIPTATATRAESKSGIGCWRGWQSSWSTLARRKRPDGPETVASCGESAGQIEKAGPLHQAATVVCERGSQGHQHAQSDGLDLAGVAGI